MSTPKVTLGEILEKWKTLTTGSKLDIHDEMNAMMQEAIAAGITASEVMRSKDKVISTWVALTWQEAQKRSEKVVTDHMGLEKTVKWANKAWWQDRKDSALKIFAKLYRENFSEMLKNERPATTTASTAQKPREDDMPVFNNLKDFQAWKSRKLAGGDA